MDKPSDNLFLRLHKWATRQDENFCTEALAFVLQTLLDRHPVAGVRLLRLMTEDFLTVPPEAASLISIRPQADTTEGRPDLEIRYPGHHVLVEVKVESELREG